MNSKIISSIVSFLILSAASVQSATLPGRDYSWSATTSLAEPGHCTAVNAVKLQHGQPSTFSDIQSASYPFDKTLCAQETEKSGKKFNSIMSRLVGEFSGLTTLVPNAEFAVFRSYPIDQACPEDDRTNNYLVVRVDGKDECMNVGITSLKASKSQDGQSVELQVYRGEGCTTKEGQREDFTFLEGSYKPGQCKISNNGKGSMKLIKFISSDKYGVSKELDQLTKLNI